MEEIIDVREKSLTVVEEKYLEELYEGRVVEGHR
jgi:hypothetical protein